MNINIAKEKIKNMLGNEVIITVHGMRNKISKYKGIIYKMYPNLFSIMDGNVERSFSYNDYIIGDVKIKII